MTTLQTTLLLAMAAGYAILALGVLLFLHITHKHTARRLAEARATMRRIREAERNVQR